METATSSWKLIIFVNPGEGFTSKEPFNIKFTRYTSKESFFKGVIEGLRVPLGTALVLYEGEAQLSMDDFIDSAIDFTRNGIRDLTTDSAEYDDEARKASVHVIIKRLASVSGAKTLARFLMSHQSAPFLRLDTGYAANICLHVQSIDYHAG